MYKKQANKEASSRLWIFFVCGGVALIIIIYAGVYYIDPKDRATFIATNILATAVACVVAVQAYINRRQWNAMQESLRQTQAIINQNEILLVPYFGIQSMQIRHTGEGESPDVKITFVNGGKTPAWDFGVIVWLAFGDDPSTKDVYHLAEVDQRIGSRFVPADGEQTATYSDPTLKIEPQMASIIWPSATSPRPKGKTHMFVCGNASYADLRGKKQFYSFETVFNPTSTTLDYWIKPDNTF